MLIVRRKIAPQSRTDAFLVLPFELRQKSRLRTLVDSGEEIGLFLDRGTMLRGGDMLEADDGRIVGVRSADDRRKHGTDAESLPARPGIWQPSRRGASRRWMAALVADDVLAATLRGLGATAPLRAPFEPEGGAYGGGDHAHAAEAKDRGSSMISLIKITR
jgi:urease accessory protein